MQKIFNSINWLIVAFTTPFALILGAIANPAGAVNGFICRIIDVVASAVPSTPDDYKIFNLLGSVGDTIPVIGRSVVLDIFSTLSFMLLIVLTIKVYKLIPFKMT